MFGRYADKKIAIRLLRKPFDGPWFCAAFKIEVDTLHRSIAPFLLGG
jgi:hypothetical protein